MSQDFARLSSRMELLPLPAPHFVGRENELHGLVEALTPVGRSPTPLGKAAVIYGEVGIGKTELAWAVALRLRSEFPDGQLAITCDHTHALISPVQQALETVVHSLDPLARLPDNLDELQQLYHSILAGRRILIIVDEVSRDDAVGLLIPPGSCAVVLITQHPLNLANAYQLLLGKLSREAAKTLVLEICPRVASEAEALIRLCDQAPLALRLSASLLAYDWTVDAHDYINDLASTGTRSHLEPDRHKDWSYALIERNYRQLDQLEQQRFCQLGVYPSQFSRTAAAALIGLSEEDSEQIDSLLDKLRKLNLVVADQNRATFRLLPTARGVALEFLGNSSETHLRFADLYADFADYCVSLAKHGADRLLLGLLIFDDHKLHFRQAWSWLQQQAPKTPTIDALILRFYKLLDVFSLLRFFGGRELLPSAQVALEAARRQNDHEALRFIEASISTIADRIGKSQSALDVHERPPQHGLTSRDSTLMDATGGPYNLSLAQAIVDGMPPRDKANIVLTGFMGTGKTTVGKLLATQLGREFVDTDDLIRARYGNSVRQIFLEVGEAAFRAMEVDLVQELAQREELVISTGGRLMLDPANVAALSKNGRVFCLVTTPEEILTRITQDRDHPRPLLEVPNPRERIVELLQQRELGYQRFLQVTTSERQPAQVAQDLLEMVEAGPKRISIDHPAQPYEYVVGSGVLPFIRQLARIDGMFVVITDSQVGELYGPSCGAVDHIITLPVGRHHKTLEVAQRVYHQLLQLGFDRTGTIAALGGSVVGDIAGYVAATYMRGVKFVQCPTSLLAMADTSIGGKVSLDLPEGKNLVGAYKAPTAVIADVATLQTLPKEEFASGMAEVIKHGLLADTDLLQKVESKTWHYEPNKLQLPLSEIQAIVAQAIQVKIAIVQQDPFEHGPRSTLNLGHTFAHAIEHVSGHAVRHGEAVAMGLVAAANLSCRLGYCSSALQERIELALGKVDLPTRIPSNLAPGSLFKAMASDKKRQAGNLRFILLHEAGQAFVAHDVPEAAVLKTLHEVSR